MSKLLKILGLSALALAFAACGRGDNTANVSAEAAGLTTAETDQALSICYQMCDRNNRGDRAATEQCRSICNAGIEMLKAQEEAAAAGESYDPYADGRKQCMDICKEAEAAVAAEYAGALVQYSEAEKEIVKQQIEACRTQCDRAFPKL